MLHFYKGTGDPLQCGRYRGVRLLEHGMKLCWKILEGRLRAVIKMSENQFSFSAGKSTTDAIFTLRRIQVKYTLKKEKFYHISIDLKKAFEGLSHSSIELALRRQLVPENLVRLEMGLYVDARPSVSASAPFEITVEVHQGSALSPLLCKFVMGEAIDSTEECRRELPGICCTLMISLCRHKQRMRCWTKTTGGRVPWKVRYESEPLKNEGSGPRKGKQVSRDT